MEALTATDKTFALNEQGCVSVETQIVQSEVKEGCMEASLQKSDTLVAVACSCPGCGCLSQHATLAVSSSPFCNGPIVSTLTCSPGGFLNRYSVSLIYNWSWIH